jgi:hypothetical protein
LRADVADGEVDETIAVLADERGERTLGEALLIGFDGGFGWLEFGVGFEAIAGDAEAAEGGVARKREGIDDFEGGVFFRAEDVLDHEARAGGQDLTCEPEALHR